MVAVDLDHLHLDPCERREVPGLALSEVDGVQPPVFVAAAILEVEKVPPVVRPEKYPDASIAIVGDDGGLLRTVHRGDPHVQHAAIGGDPGQAAAVGCDARASPLRVAKQHLAGNERGSSH